MTHSSWLAWLHVLVLCALNVLAQEDPKPYVERIPLRTHSIYAPYIDQDLQNRWFDFGADAVVNTNKHIRLTHDRQSQTGWLWSRLPLTSQAFTIMVSFRINSASSNLYGDGLALWLTKERANVGPVFGGQDLFEGLGIFFDTYANNRRKASRFPYVLAMMGDGKTRYDNDLDGKTQELGGCSIDFRSSEESDVPTTVRLTYDANPSPMLKLEIAPSLKGGMEKGDWQECFIIHGSSVQLPATRYLGLTALTGDVSEVHDIISIETFLSPPVRAAPPGKPDPKYPGKQNKQSSGLWRWFVWYLKLLAIGSIAVVAILVYRVIQGNQDSRKHF